MGILNQLREEANQKKENELNKLTRKEQLEKNYQTQILPRMQNTFHFMKELVDHLKFLEHAIKIENYSSHYPQFGTLTQTDYKINTDGIVGFVDSKRLMQINVSFQCLGDGDFFIKKKGEFAIEQEIAFLHEKQIKFKWNPAQSFNETANIKIYKNFPVNFRFEVDYEQSQIKLHIKNHAEFDNYTKTFQPDEVNDELLDEIARFMLRKDCDFIRLKISNKQKQDIRLRLDEYNQQQTVMQQQIQFEESQERSLAKKSLFSRINPFSKNKK
ncbi:MAG: hypothetical protein GQ532_03175 [Methylomarinum sp.]|nr:hypothetical protein [Methylomarinum sp.]